MVARERKRDGRKVRKETRKRKGGMGREGDSDYDEHVERKQSSQYLLLIQNKIRIEVGKNKHAKRSRRKQN